MNASGSAGNQVFTGFNTTTFWSGLVVSPVCFGPRLNSESLNWSRYRFRKLNFCYVASCPTSVSGRLTLVYGRDPAEFIEASGTQTTPTVSYINMTQAIPSCGDSVWRDFVLPIVCNEDKLYYTELVNYTKGNDLGTLAELRDCAQGRLAGLTSSTAVSTAQTFGELWVSGVCEFYNPSYSQLAVGSSYAPNTTPSLSSSSLGSTSTTDQKRKFTSYNLTSKSWFQHSIGEVEDSRFVDDQKALSKPPTQISMAMPTKVSWEDDEGTP